MLPLFFSLAVAEPAPAPAPQLAPISADRQWQVLSPKGTPRERLKAAGEALGDWEIQVAGVSMTGPYLVDLAASAPEEPFTRVVREAVRQAVDLEDLLYFLDDVLAAGEAGRRGEPFFVSAGRGRSAGFLIHPDDVFKKKPRVYPRKRSIAVDEPAPQESYPPAADGDLLGPEWTMRFRNPTERPEMYKTLAERRPEATLSSRVASLVSQLEAQGTSVYLTSFLRWPERGYLMWGAFEPSRCDTSSCVSATVAKLEDRKAAWGLDVAITWSHPEGWQATKEAARRMADAYDVVYATEKGAHYSRHYEGVAVDFVAVGLPRELTLLAPDGARHTFDLSQAEATRDLSLTPPLIDWVEEHFGLVKLHSDYPHWTDARKD